MTPVLQKVLKKILSEYDENKVNELIAEGMHNYVDDDDIEEYGSLEEAYEEIGRGGSESDVFRSIITPYNLDPDDYCAIHDALKEEWGIYSV